MRIKYKEMQNEKDKYAAWIYIPKCFVTTNSLEWAFSTLKIHLESLKEEAEDHLNKWDKIEKIKVETYDDGEKEHLNAFLNFLEIQKLENPPKKFINKNLLDVDSKEVQDLKEEIKNLKKILEINGIGEG